MPTLSRLIGGLGLALGLVGCRAVSTGAQGGADAERGQRAASAGAPAAPPPPAAPPRQAGAGAPVEGDPWVGPDACEGLVRRGGRMARPPGVARIGSWNVRWFPDGAADRVAELDEGTDVAWLACTIAWLDVDALAVQEFKAGEAAAGAGRALTERLRALTGSGWTLALDRCTGTDQHVGLLLREAAVRASPPRTEESLHPKGRCGLGLRPGLSSTLRWPGGLSLELISLHLDSGTTARDQRNRLASLQAAAALPLPEGEDDRVLAGDFNLMGCQDCLGAPGAAEELETARAALGPTRLLPGGEPCTRVGRGTPVLDRMGARGLGELPAAAQVRVVGACQSGCGRPAGRAAVERLSDHCPIVLDLPDRHVPG